MFTLHTWLHEPEKRCLLLRPTPGTQTSSVANPVLGGSKAAPLFDCHGGDYPAVRTLSDSVTASLRKLRLRSGTDELAGRTIGTVEASNPTPQGPKSAETGRLSHSTKRRKEDSAFRNQTLGLETNEPELISKSQKSATKTPRQPRAKAKIIDRFQPMTCERPYLAKQDCIRERLCTNPGIPGRGNSLLMTGPALRIVVPLTRGRNAWLLSSALGGLSPTLSFTAPCGL